MATIKIGVLTEVRAKKRKDGSTYHGCTVSEWVQP